MDKDVTATPFFSRKVPISALLGVALLLVLALVLPRIVNRTNRQLSNSVEGVELKDFILKVKSELYAAEKAEIDAHEMPLFKLHDVELVANFVVRSSAGAEVRLVTVTGNTSAEIERSQQITLHLDPIAPQRETTHASPNPLPPTDKIDGQIAPPH